MKPPPMNTLSPSAAALCAVLFVGCSIFTPARVRAALDVAQIACITANADAPSAEVAEACAIAGDLIPVVERVLVDFRAKRAAYAHAQLAAARCAEPPR